MDKLRLIIADDHLVVRKGFLYMLKLYQEIDLLGEAASGKEAIQLCEQQQPDVVLMDVKMPDMDGIEATRHIREHHPGIQVILLTSYENDAALVQQGLEAGAVSFLYKNIQPEELVRVLRDAADGQSYLSPRATQNLIHYRTEPPVPDYRLTDREIEVLGLMVNGLTNNDIAEHLSVSTATAKFHVSSILGKLHATTRTEAVAIALKHKLVNG